MPTETLPDLIPLEVLLGNPERVNPQLSPDGKRMAYLAPVNDVLNVWVGTVGKDDYKPITHDTDRGIQGYFWTYDAKHILYIQDKGGDENWRIYRVNLATEEVVDLTPFEGVQAQFVSYNKDLPNEILIGLNKENPQSHDVYHLTIDTGKLELRAKNPGNVAGWIADRELRIRGCLAATNDAGFELQVRDTEDDDFETLIKWESQDALASGPGSFSKDGKHIFITDSRESNTGRYFKYEIASGESKLIAEDPDYDVGGVMTDPDTYEPEAVSFNRDRNEWRALTDEVKKDFEAIRDLDHGDFFVVNRDLENTTWLVAFTTDNGPIPYYSYERKTKKAKFLFNHRPDLEKYTMAQVAPVSLKSRDGLTLHGYLTLPPGSDGKNLPMVLDVHGGPWARDAWGFNPESQWLANRGYACLQVNFRGSTGYGKEFVNAGDREWGGKMHDDLIDAVNWAVEQGIADKERIAIYGGSYGGYATLVGATFTPDVFRCAVSIVGPSNLITFIKSIPPYWEPLRKLFQSRIGDPAKDREFLESRSPLSKVDEIKIPMLIGQGANDPRVKKAESIQIVEAMKAKGIDHEYLEFPDEGHGFVKPENRLKFYRVADKFLAKHLGGRAED